MGLGRLTNSEAELVEAMLVDVFQCIAESKCVVHQRVQMVAIVIC